MKYKIFTIDIGNILFLSKHYEIDEKYFMDSFEKFIQTEYSNKLKLIYKKIKEDNKRKIEIEIFSNETNMFLFKNSSENLFVLCFLIFRALQEKFKK